MQQVAGLYRQYGGAGPGIKKVSSSIIFSALAG